MNHSFDIEHATTHGLIEAIMIGNLQFWIAKNKANEVNFRDGRTWTYNSVAAFARLFPYLSAKQIRGALDRLIEAGVLVGGNYNERAADRTKWYAFSDESIFLPGQTHLPSGANGTASRGNSVNKSDVNNSSKPDTKPDGGTAQRATRLAPDWKLPKAWGEWALAEFKEAGWTAEYVRKVADKFRDHWISVPGRAGVKLKWDATWRNWCRGEPAPRREGATGGGAWYDTASGIDAKAKEVGITALPGESMPSLKARIIAAIENGGKPPAAAPSRLPQAFSPLPEDGGGSSDSVPGKDDPAVKKALSNLKKMTKARNQPKDDQK
jgi:hypothetical protein